MLNCGLVKGAGSKSLPSLCPMVLVVPGVMIMSVSVRAKQDPSFYRKASKKENKRVARIWK